MENMIDYGILYKKVKIDDEFYIFRPIELVEGCWIKDKFESYDTFSTLASINDILTNDVLVDGIYSRKQLKSYYELDDIELLKKNYLTEQKNNIILIQIKNDELHKNTININSLDKKWGESYTQDTVSLNYSSIEKLLDMEDLNELKSTLQKYLSNIDKFNDRMQKESLTSITLENNKVIGLGGNINVITDNSKEKEKTDFSQNGDISLSGLEKYIKERIFGHDEEIEKIATILIMNHTALKEDGTQSILIPGPTGTGKTSTFEVACEYLNIPFKLVDTSNLVTQGIKGESLEDCLYSLILSANGDMEIAKRGIIVFDEFDKLGEETLDIKAPIKNILLKFIEGSDYIVQHYGSFNTTLNSKVFLGAFEELVKKNSPMGFGSSNEIEEFDLKKLYEKKYFNRQMITRLPHIIPYKELDRKTKKEALLYAKSSKLYLKKLRYKREYGIDLIVSDDYIDALLDCTDKIGNSFRDLNNIILNNLLGAEHEILDNKGKYKKLVLNSETVKNPKKFDIA